METEIGEEEVADEDRVVDEEVVDEDRVVDEKEEVAEVVEEEKPKSKRGRKSKADKKDPTEQVEKVQRIRGRKKKYDIDSIKKLKSENNEHSAEKVVFSSNSKVTDLSDIVPNSNIKETQISFGLLNIGIQSTGKPDPKELRRQADINFGISDNDKAPEVLSQESGRKNTEFVIRKAKSSEPREQREPREYIAPDTGMMRHEKRNEVLEYDEEEFNDVDEEEVIKKVTKKASVKESSKESSKEYSKESAKESAKEILNDVLNDATKEDVEETEGKKNKKDSKAKTKAKTTKAIKKIHKVLGTIEEWPEKTNLLCWWCCHSFTSNPVPCPISYDRISNRFKVRGIFCGWACATAYSMSTFKEVSNIYLFRQKMNEKIDISDIRQAPDKIVLKDFGGFMSIEEFRAFGTEGEGVEGEGKKNHKIIISTDHISYSNQEILEYYNGK